MKLAKLLPLAFVAVLFVGCSSVAFTPKPLDYDARGITVVKETPYNCKVLGETEGYDEADNRSGATYEKVRKGAYNDLRNEALAVVRDSNHRITLRIVQEDIVCGNNIFYQIKCNQINSNIYSYRVKAQIFDCGNRE